VSQQPLAERSFFKIGLVDRSDVAVKTMILSGKDVGKLLIRVVQCQLETKTRQDTE
jgi:hypothetical protein